MTHRPDIRLDGLDVPKSWSGFRGTSTRLDFVEQFEEVAVWRTSEGEGQVVFLPPEQLARLHTWLTEYLEDQQ